ncbi:MAG: methyltransferase family protein [Planctomycetota bacterium]|jgi:protein-S-isoprenylcysteine O-methyltransferase Ste14
MRAFLRAYGQTVVNVLVSGVIGCAAVYRAHGAWLAEEFDLVEALFFSHCLVLVVVIIVRRQHVSMERGVFPQVVALVAFFSSLAFDKEPKAPCDWMPMAAEIIAVAGIVLGMAVLLNLGRSFGIMIAVRSVKTRGVYGVVRHPMYVTDTILRTSFVLVNPSAYNLLLYVAATACYVYRAILEERFLSQLPEYREYAEKVRYRFIPGIW